MKLLGWMHRKLCHNNTEQIKYVTIAFDNQGCHTNAFFGSNQELEKKTIILESELFDGFLAIGTLGSEPILSEPATPTFPMSSEDIAEVTENDLKLFNEKLEKFLEAEADEDGPNEVSSGRSSYVSIVTLIGKPSEGAKDEPLKCPLQGYLFGSSLENSETNVEASYGELFQKTKLEENSPENFIKEHPIEVKQTNKTAKHLIKKFLKRLCVCYSKDSNLSAKTNSSSKKKKFCKFAQMFHKKIHPASPKTEKELHKANREHIESALYDDANENTHHYCVKKLYPHGYMKNEGTRCNEAIKLYNCHSSGNREHWIKTDADYFVLEL
ncbi:hypothetical protein ACFE04_009825 [Oxalis oulophora]